MGEDACWGAPVVGADAAQPVTLDQSHLSAKLSGVERGRDPGRPPPITITSAARAST